MEKSLFALLNQVSTTLFLSVLPSLYRSLTSPLVVFFHTLPWPLYGMSDPVGSAEPFVKPAQSLPSGMVTVLVKALVWPILFFTIPFGISRSPISLT